MKEDAGRGWRNVLSPTPIRIVEIDSVRKLWDSTIITVGGAGVIEGRWFIRRCCGDKDLALKG